LVTYDDNPDKIIVHPNGSRTVKGAHSLGQQVERKQYIMVGIVVGVVELQIFYFSKYCDVNLYMYFGTMFFTKEGAQL
jgi:hypothetical protein